MEVVHSGSSFEGLFFTTNFLGNQRRRGETITPSIEARGRVVIQVHRGRFVEPDAYAYQRVLPFLVCWRIVHILERCRPKQIRFERHGSTLDDLVAAMVDGSRDYEVMRRLRIDFGMTSSTLLPGLAGFAEEVPSIEVREAIRQRLEALVDNNECFEDFLEECGKLSNATV